MKYLLDTHIILWAALDVRKLSRKAKSKPANGPMSWRARRACCQNKGLNLRMSAGWLLPPVSWARPPGQRINGKMDWKEEWRCQKYLDSMVL